MNTRDRQADPKERIRLREEEHHREVEGRNRQAASRALNRASAQRMTRREAINAMLEECRQRNPGNSGQVEVQLRYLTRMTNDNLQEYLDEFGHTPILLVSETPEEATARRRREVREEMEQAQAMRETTVHPAPAKSGFRRLATWDRVVLEGR